MIKDLSCNEEGNNFIRDWLEWHKMLVVEQFSIYKNGSEADAKNLEVLKHYINKKQATLINWPYYIRGWDNNMAQKVSLNHAIFAFSGRTKYMGFFDVDEFFIPKQTTADFLQDKNQNILLDILSKCIHFPQAINVYMRNMMHLDHCLKSNAEQVTQLLPSIQSPASLLGLCTHYGSTKEKDEHSKTFRHFDEPKAISTRNMHQ